MLFETDQWPACNYCQNQLSPDNLIGPGEEYCNGCGASAFESEKYWNPETGEIKKA